MSMQSKLNFKLRNSSFLCSICGYHSGKLLEVRNPPKNGKGPNKVGHIFMKCTNEPECRASTWFGPHPPRIINGAVGNDTDGLWILWDNRQGPKLMPPNALDTYSGYKRRREEEEEEETFEAPAPRSKKTEEDKENIDPEKSKKLKKKARRETIEASSPE